MIHIIFHMYSNSAFQMYFVDLWNFFMDNVLIWMRFLSYKIYTICSHTKAFFWWTQYENPVSILNHQSWRSEKYWGGGQLLRFIENQDQKPQFSYSWYEIFISALIWMKHNKKLL